MCNQLYVSFVGTFEFLTKVQNIFQQEIGVSPTSLQIKCKKRMTNNYQFAIGGNKKVQKVLEWIYKDSTIHLERKFNRFQEFKNNYSASIFLKNMERISRMNRVCSTSGCNNKIIARGLCNKCYQKEYYINSQQPK
jgi:adenosine deaminase